MIRSKLKGAAALFFAASLALVAWDGPVGRTVELEGYLFDTRDASGSLGPRIAGAVVSVSLDTVVAVTDERGYFHLRTNRRVSGDEFYTITVQARGIAFRARTMIAQERGYDFVLTSSGGLDIYPSVQRQP